MLTERRPPLLNLLKMSRAWQQLAVSSPDEIDVAIDYLELLEELGEIGADEAATWRWRLLACWAELQRPPA